MKLLVAGVVLAGALMGVLHSGGHRLWPVLLAWTEAVSGFMATAAGLGGPPVALVYQHETGLRLRGTLAWSFIIGTIVSLLALAWAGRFEREELRLSFLLIPGTGCGYFMSRPAAAYLTAGIQERPSLPFLHSLPSASSRQRSCRPT